MSSKETLMVFPCDFQIKVIGNNQETFANDVIAIARKYYPTLANANIKRQPSQQANYLAITLTVHAEDQPTLDALYTELTKHPDTKMVL